MGRSVRLWGWALALSLLLHVCLLGGLEWRLPHRTSPPEPPPIDVRLVPPPPPVAVAASPSPRPPPAHEPAVPRPAVRLPPPSIAPAPEPPAEAAAPEAPADESVVVPHPPALTPPQPVVEAPMAGPAEPATAPSVPLNALPPRIDLTFELRYGLASGEQTLVWVNDGEHYTLASVAGATGLTGLFYRGRFAQTSRGRVTPHGLQPEEFWDQRGDRRSSARFDQAQGQITLIPEKGVPRHFPYQGEVQDVLSLFFQFALTAPPAAGQRLAYRVFNGKKLRDYAYEVRGEAMLDTALGMLQTLHIAQVADDDGRFEVWLAIDHYYLPVRVLRSDDAGREMELRIRSIVP
ncbi:MAG: hypothetical protein ABT22_03510 [Thiobacillus sp. SCN 64-317]|nr:MAG: hypothetical protein ABT22_03510 [Thiobacillus sp. SCN 64-317]